MDLSARIAAAKAKANAAKAALSDEDRAEIAQRAELAEIEAERKDAEQTARDLDLERRMNAAQEALGEDVEITGVSPKTFKDTFIVRRDSAAHKQWKDSTRTKASAEARGAKAAMDQNEIDLKYALKVIVDWNGLTDFSTNPASTLKLSQFLKANTGILTPIMDEAGKLAGVFAEATSKSD